MKKICGYCHKIANKKHDCGPYFKYMEMPNGDNIAWNNEWFKVNDEKMRYSTMRKYLGIK